jgi:choice-of-anchor C domain-containing protein
MSRTSLFSWLFVRTPRRKARTARRPGLEALEDRALPANLLVNGGFEEPPVPEGSDFVTVTLESSDQIPGWSVGGSVDVVKGTWQPSEGDQSLDLNGFAPGLISQSFATTPGARYRLSFAYADTPGEPVITSGLGDEASATVRVFAEDETVLLNQSLTHSGSAPDNMQYTPFSDTFTATSATSFLLFEAQSQGDGGVVLDAVSVDLIAEDADLTLTAQAPASVPAGHTLTYEITVTNQGPGPATAVTLTDALPEHTTFISLTAPDGWTPTTPAVGSAGTVTVTASSLAGGASATFSLTVLVARGTPADTTLTTTPAVASSATDPDPSDNQATPSTTVLAAWPIADLAIGVTASVSSQNTGTVTYTVTVGNFGPDASAADTAVQLMLPGGTTFVPGSSTAGLTVQNGVVTATLGSVPSGGLRTVTVVASNASGTLTAQASVTASVDDPDLSNNSRSVVVSSPASVPLTRRLLNRHQEAERRQLNLYFRRLSALLRAHQLLERRLLVAKPFDVPPPAAPIPTPFPF